MDLYEFLMLHELLAFTIPSSEEEFGKEVIERATRILGVRRIALFVELDCVKCMALLGFRNDRDALDAIEEAEILKPDNVFIHRFEGGVLYLEHPLNIKNKKRFFQLFSKRVEELARHFILERRKIELEKKNVLLKSIPDPVVVVSPDGAVKDVNNAWINLTELSTSDVSGKKIYELPCFDDESRIRLSEMVGKWTEKFEVVVISGGKPRYLEINPAKIEGSEDYVLVCRDVTELRKITIKFWRTVDLLEALVDSIPDVVYFKDTCGRNIVVNKAYAELVGKPKEDIVGKRDDEILPPYLAAQCRESDELVMTKGDIVRTEETGYINGRKITFETIKAPVYDKGGEFIGIIGISRDITERVRAEELKRFRTLMDYSNDAIFLVEAESGKIIDVNMTACEWLGYTKDELLEKTIYDVMDLPAWRGEAVEGWHVRRDGSKFPISVSLKECELEGRRYLVIIARDITRLKEAEERIKRMNKHLSLLNKMLRHDIKNGLTIIKGYLDLYRDSGNEEFLKKIEERIAVCTELISTIREIEEALMAGRGLKIVDISKVLEKEIEKVKDKAIVNVKIPAGLKVLADDMIPSIFENVLLNAIFHNDKEEKRVDIEARAINGWVEVRIADNGPGIPDEIKEEIFKEGFKGEKTGRTGLGLYLVKTLIERYGGSIHVEDNEPEGSVFILRFRSGGVNDE
ncbi:PAS domain-containing sensor histidine kinase [Archaeoglobus veneficus]|uniref:PAS/PAC sensor signal transduction histidine kinase n=1 Tax=Archaeoglobus veneficus (strain DSM 11195 / SNP6) TaxID=693661 RepID=F2KNJ8_ARCVS|nr:PAS domain-containing sensor histidine kinase [Archaeoglobus veneficus]AEA46226.1 PAS/PAC sensor signal transduction histidine kinase [Archaeoglobus veneficus SNP6]